MGKNKIQIKQLIKEKIKKDFICLKKTPKWLQEPNWIIEKGIPLIFVGEHDISSMFDNTTKVYIFYNPKNDEFTCIKQSV